MHPKGAKNKLAQAIFSKEGPNLTSPAVTKSLVTQKYTMYQQKN